LWFWIFFANLATLGFFFPWKILFISRNRIFQVEIWRNFSKIKEAFGLFTNLRPKGMKRKTECSWMRKRWELHFSSSMEAQFGLVNHHAFRRTKITQVPTTVIVGTYCCDRLLTRQFCKLRRKQVPCGEFSGAACGVVCGATFGENARNRVRRLWDRSYDCATFFVPPALERGVLSPLASLPPPPPPLPCNPGFGSRRKASSDEFPCRNISCNLSSVLQVCFRFYGSLISCLSSGYWKRIFCLSLRRDSLFRSLRCCVFVVVFVPHRTVIVRIRGKVVRVVTESLSLRSLCVSVCLDFILFLVLFCTQFYWLLLYLRKLS
jgi:hypothetical protein